MGDLNACIHMRSCALKSKRWKHVNAKRSETKWQGRQKKNDSGLNSGATAASQLGRSGASWRLSQWPASVCPHNSRRSTPSSGEWAWSAVSLSSPVTAAVMWQATSAKQNKHLTLTPAAALTHFSAFKVQSKAIISKMFIYLFIYWSMHLWWLNIFL